MPLDGAGGDPVGELEIIETSVVPWSGTSRTVATGIPSTKTVETLGGSGVVPLNV